MSRAAPSANIQAECLITGSSETAIGTVQAIALPSSLRGAKRRGNPALNPVASAGLDCFPPAFAGVAMTIHLF
jgi:hypothetical protein